MEIGVVLKIGKNLQIIIHTKVKNIQKKIFSNNPYLIFYFEQLKRDKISNY